MKTENANQIAEFLNAAYSATDCVVYDPLIAEERIWFSPADDLEEITAEILEGNNNRNRNAYFGVNCRKPNQTGAAGTDYAVMYFADFDGVEPAQAESQISEAGLPVASAVVMSGTGTHAYWFLIEQEHNLDEWEHRQEWIATAVSSDPAVCDRQRLSRLPGTLNNKPKYKHDPPRSELLRCVKDCRYSWRELQPKCDPPTTPEPKEPTPKRERVNGELLPGDDYMNRTKWQELLPAGWRPVGKVRNGLQAWTHGIDGSRNKSATVRIGDETHPPAIYPWSTTQNILPPNQWHTMFYVYALLHHGGITSAASSELSKRGYGKPCEMTWLAGEGGTISTVHPSPIVVGAANLLDPSTLTDIGLGRRLVAESGGCLRFAHDTGRWYWYDGRRWVEDSNAIHAKQIAKTSAEQIWRQLSEMPPTQSAKSATKFALEANKRRSIDNAVALALSEPLLAVRTEEFNSDPWVLNCENGILDLRTFDLRKHHPDDLVTQLANVEYDPLAFCPKWNVFIKTITCGDKGLAAFLQRSFGLVLSADQSEQAIWIHYGTGSNGKGTLLSVVMDVLGHYAGPGNVGSFVNKKQEGDRSRAVASMVGKRLIFAQETDDGCRLSEQAVKEFTGSDPVAYRRLYQEEAITFPTWHIHLAVNERPQIRGTDNGIWRRVKLVPWNHRFSGEDQRKREDIHAEFMEERSGILNWLLMGLTDWRMRGLQEPESVKVAINEYREESDTIAAWIADECHIHPQAVTRATELYTAYREWCRRTGHRAFTQNKFGRELESRGFRKEKPTHGEYRRAVVRHGIELAPIGTN